MILRTAAIGLALTLFTSAALAGDETDKVFLDGATDPAPTRTRSDTYLLSVAYSEGDASTIRTAALFALGERSQLTVDLGYVHSPIERDDLNTYRGGISFGHDFGRNGFELGYEYWGDLDSIDTHTVRGSFDVHGAMGRIALLAERRNIELDFNIPLGARAFVPDSKSAISYGIGASARYSGDKTDFYASGMLYDYNIDMSRLNNIDLSQVPPSLRPILIQRLNDLLFALRRLNASSFTLANSFLDSSVSAGIDVRFGDKTLNIELSHDVLVADNTKSNGITVGWLHSLCGVCDIEYRIGLTKDEIVGSSLYGGVMVYWYH